MNTKIIRTLVKKEMLDVFRDKKTVIMMMVVPVILYPLIFIGAMQVVAFISSSMETQNYRIAVDAGDDGAFLHKLLEQGETDEEENAYEITIVDAASVADYEAALNEETIDVYVAGKMQDGRMQYDVYYLNSVTNSDYAAGIVMEAFDELREDMTRQRIEAAGLNVHEILEPIGYEKENMSSSEQSLGSIMGSVLPFMLIISLLMGMISALLNILSMGGIAFYIYAILEMQSDVGSFDMAMFVPAILVCMLAIFAFSLFISAVTMCVTSFAKSYKEANNYITPLMLVVMFVGYIGFIPNLELTRAMAMMPVANICLLIKNMLVFKVDYGLIAVVLISNVAYAVVAILFLSKIYDSEAILFSEQKGSLQLFEKRSNLRKGGVPTVSDVWFVVAVTILLVLYAGSLLQVKYGLAGVFGTQLILLLVPLALVIYTKKDMKLTYGFTGTGAAGFVGSAFLAVGVYLINIMLAGGLMKLFPQSAEGEIQGGFGDRHNGGVVWRLSYESGEVYPDGASGRRAVLCGMEDGKHLSGHADAFSEQRLQCDRHLLSGAGRQSRADACQRQRYLR